MSGACVAPWERRGQPQAAYCISFSPDGQLLAVGLYAPTIQVRDAQSGELIHALDGHTYHPTSLAFSPTAKQLAATAWDHRIWLWELGGAGPQSQPGLRMLEGHTGMVLRVCFLASGEALASAAHDNTIRVWQLGTGQCQCMIQLGPKPILAIEFSADAAQAAVVHTDNTVCLWEVGTGRQLSRPGRLSELGLEVHGLSISGVQGLCPPIIRELVACGARDPRVVASAAEEKQGEQ